MYFLQPKKLCLKTIGIFYANQFGFELLLLLWSFLALSDEWSAEIWQPIQV
jgi:hypothetical protein